MILKKGQQNEFWTEERCFITEVFNSPSSPNVSLAQARVEPQIKTQVHQLSCDEIYYILSGNGILHIDQHKHELAAGDIAFIKKGQNQSIFNPSQKEDLIFLCICSPRFELDDYRNME